MWLNEGRGYICICSIILSHPDVVEDEIDYSIPKHSPASSLKRSLPLADTSSTKDQKVI